MENFHMVDRSIVLQNEKILIAISPQGAELKKLQVRATKQELLWQGDPQLWSRSAPWLFPIVGKLKNNQFSCAGKTYSLPQHGFARDCRFQVVQTSEEVANFILEFSEQSLSQYPFEFRLSIRYELHGCGFKTQIEIGNLGRDVDLPCSFGMHPGFNLFGPSSVIFDREETPFIGLNEIGVLVEEQRAQLDNERTLKIEPSLFEKGALILKSIRSSKVEFTSGSTRIQMSLTNWKSFGIWSPQTTGDLRFVCLEPWCGYNDPENHDSSLVTKPGVIWIEPGRSYWASVDFSISDTVTA